MRAFISLLFIIAGLVISYPQTTTASTTWWNTNWHYRTPLTLSATNGTDAVITLSIALTTLKQKSGSTNDLVPESFRIINHADNSLLTSQLGNKNTATNTIEISFYLPGDAASATPYLYFDSETPAASQLQIPSLITHTQQQFQGQETYMITTPRATYAFQKQAGGLASIFDRDNRDWISFNTSAGSAGMYRGIPNLVYPGNIFHPGYHHATTTITTQGPLYLELKSTAQAGAWEAIWRFYPTTAQLQVTKTPQAAKYWFLYEGTPGGTISTNAGAMDKYTLADATSFDITATKDGDLPNPEWLYFQDPALNRSFFLLHHEDDAHADKYYLMENNMTVFGFGRDGLNKYLTGQNSFTLGFVENKTHATVAKAVTTQLSPSTASLGSVEAAHSSPTPTTGALHPKSPDFDNDGKVSLADLQLFVINKLQQVLDFDVVGNGTVDIFDFNQVIAKLYSAITPPASPTTEPGSNPGKELVVYDWNKKVKVEDHGFPSDEGNNIKHNTDWTQPVNYAGGTIYYRVQIKSQPVPQDGMHLQLCFWQAHPNPNIQDNFYNENCGSQHNVKGTANNVQTWSDTVGSLWKKDGRSIDWDRPRFRVGVAVKNVNHNPVSDYVGWNWNGENPNDWYPLDYRFTAVVVEKGKTFSGWQNYP